MAYWNLINPSDPITLKSNNFELVALAVLLLGEGHYGCDEVNGERSVPIFSLGGAEALDKWAVETFDCASLQALAESKDLLEVAEVLDSAVVGSVSSRKAYEKVMSELSTEEERKNWKHEYHKDRVTSLNDICTQAWELSRNIKDNSAAA